MGPYRFALGGWRDCDGGLSSKAVGGKGLCDEDQPRIGYAPTLREAAIGGQDGLWAQLSLFRAKTVIALAMKQEQTANIKAKTQVEVPVCPLCESESVDTIQHTDVFEYGVRGSVVQLNVDLPVRYCAACDLEFLDHVGQRLRHDAVCRYLGVLTPAEVRRIREGHGMTRAEFARLTGLGEATLGRWELAAVIQNPANDRYLRLLRRSGAMQVLRQLAQTTPEAFTTEPGIPCQFEALDDPASVARRAQCFRLRGAGSSPIGPLTPSEVRQIREIHGMTRAEFAKLTGLGEATLGRWEAGKGRMNRANELYLKMIQKRPSAIQFLQQFEQARPEPSNTEAVVQAQFEALLVSSTLVGIAQIFRLRKTGV